MAPLHTKQVHTLTTSATTLLVGLALAVGLARASYLLPAAAQQQQQQQMPDAASLAPSIIPFSFNQNVQENQRAMVMCTTSSGEIPVTFAWLKDGQLLTPAHAQAKRIVIKLDQDALTLKIPSVRLDHAGNYTCVAKNRLGSQAHSAQLVVHGEPRWLREPHTEPIVTTRGQTVVIDCQTTGWPRPQQTWQIKTHLQNEFEPLATANAGGRISLAPNGSLVIRNADKSDEANYLCKSSNGIGKGLSWSTSLKVTVPAHFDQTHKQQPVVVRRQSQVQLRCDAYGDQPITIEWFKNKQPLSQSVELDSASARYSVHSNNNPLKNGLISQLLIKQTQRQDNGLYECVTRNPYGRDRLPLELIVQEEPDSIQELQATQVNSRSTTLMWNEPYDGRSGISSYMFQYRKIQDVAPSANQLLSAMAEAGFDGYSDSIQSEMSAVAAQRASSASISAAAAAAATTTTTGSNSLDGDWQHAARIMLPVQANSSSPGAVKSITIEKLEPSSRYLLRALATNAIGHSKFSQPMEFATDEEAPEIGPINIRAQALNSTSIQVSWDEIPRSKQLGRIHGYYIGYRAASNNTAAANFIYKPYIVNDLVGQQQQQQLQQQAIGGSISAGGALDGAQQQVATNQHAGGHSASQRLETTIHELKRDTVYEITVVAFNSRGSGPSSDFVVCRTVEMEAPKPVKLQIRRESNESIFIEWQRDPTDQNPVDDYVLYQEKNSASQEWLQVRLPGNQTQYKASGLKCGTRYQFYIVAQNKVGRSAPSEVVGASTSGALPAIPMKTSLIKLVNSTCLMVNLNSFQDNSCRIKTFTVRYRVEKIAASNLNSLNKPLLALPSSVASSTGAAGPLMNSQGIMATHQALSSSMPAPSGKSAGAGSLAAASAAAAAAANGLPMNSGAPALTTSEWINIRPKSNLKHQRANEEDRMEYLCDLSPVGEYTIHVAASNDVGRSEAEYLVNMASDELRHSALKDLFEFLNGLPNVFAYIPSVLVFVFAALSLGLVGLILYTTAIKYYQKFVIMQNQMRATRRAKADEKRRRKLANMSQTRQSQKTLDLWTDEYEEEELDNEELADGDDEDGDTTDGQDSSGGSAGSRTAVMNHHHNQHNQRHRQQLRHQQAHQQQHQQHARQFSHSGHYLSNISNSAFDTSSIDSPCAKFNGSACMSTASSDSIHGRFHCLNSKQYVKMNEYTMLPPSHATQPATGPPATTATTELNPASLQATASDIYGISTGPANGMPLQQALNLSASNSPNHNAASSLYYSTLRRTNMQTYLPQQQQQQQQQQQLNRRHSQNVSDIYGYYMAPQARAAAAAAAAAQAQQAANEAAHSIFVPPQQIIYSAPNIRRQPPVFL